MSEITKLATEAELQLRSKSLTGDVDHYPEVRAIVVMSEDGLVPVMLTVRAAEAPDEHALLAEGFAQAIEAQDPTRHTSEDLDCVSCHVAEGARRVGVELYDLTPTGEFTSARSLAYRRDGKALTDLHAFSYLGAQVSIMRRTSHESAVVADWFQDALLAE